MVTVQRSLSTSIRNALLVFLLLFSGAVLSQETAVVVPNHATPKDYGKGWECNQGFHNAGDSCDPVVVPENAYPTNARYGTGWKCDRGYRPDNEQCIAIEVPEHGYLADNMSYGVGWKCGRGYKADKGACRSVKVPPNAYLNDSGDGWQCAQNYRRTRDTCKLQQEVNRSSSKKYIFTNYRNTHMIQDKQTTEEDLKLMSQFGITHERKSVYFFQGHKYDKLDDAIRYASLAHTKSSTPTSTE